jgi:hypothetical protein
MKTLFTVFVFTTWIWATDTTDAKTSKDYRCALECVKAALNAPNLESIDTLSQFSEYQKRWIKKRFEFHFPHGKKQEVEAETEE